VRQLKILGVSLIAAFAMAAVASSPAVAATECKKGQVLYGETCETVQEHANYQSFANCPLHTPPINEEYEELPACVGGESFYKETWQSKTQKEEWETNHGKATQGLLSHFTAGKVTVALKNSITLRGGFEQNKNTEELVWIGARGAATIQPVAQPTIPLTKGVNTALLSQSELERYYYYVKHAKDIKTTATVELAGPAEQIVLSLANQLSEEGVAFVFPVKVKLSNSFLGDSCYVGSDASPIKVPFTTGQDGELHGKAGQFVGESNNSIIAIWGDTLVSSSFSTPGVEGCGVEGGADEAVDSALGLPSATGNTAVLNGVLKISGAETVEKALKGEI
jgi:hypothetical protein